MNQQRQEFCSKKPKNTQADKLQDDNVEKNITPANYKIKRMYILKFGK